MDEYSFISENGTVRQIRDLIAKAKDEEQDVRLDTLESAVSGGSYSYTEKKTGKKWVDGKDVYSIVINCGTGGLQAGYWFHIGTAPTGFQVDTLINASVSETYGQYQKRVVTTEGIMFDASDNKICVWTTFNWAAVAARVAILEYTKP